MAEQIKIDGLNEFVRNLRKIDAELPKTLRKGLNTAAEIVIDYARPRFPRRTGRAAGTLRAQSTRTAVRVTEGGKRAPYVPWLDFGGRVGPKRSVKRPFVKEGRFLYAGLHARREQIQAATVEALVDAARAAGVEVD